MDVDELLKVLVWSSSLLGCNATSMTLIEILIRLKTRILRAALKFRK